MSPVNTLKAGPLAGQDLSLLKAGTSVLRIDTGMALHLFLRRKSDATLRSASRLIQTRKIEGSVERFFDPVRFSYIGERGEDGWIVAPEGGWSENPAPGMRIDLRPERGEWCYGVASEQAIWRRTSVSWPVIAFRPATPEPAHGSRPAQEPPVLTAPQAEKRISSDYAEKRFPSPAYITSGAHLSGYRVTLGYETLTDAQDAHAALAQYAANGSLTAETAANSPDNGFSALDHLIDEAFASSEPSVPTVQAEGVGVGWPVDEKGYPNTLGGYLGVARRVLRNIPRPQVNDGAAVVYSVSDDVPEDIFVALSYIDAAIAALPNATSTAGEVGEPVAWRARYAVGKTVDTWSLHETEPKWLTSNGSGDYEVQPLYARQQAAVSADPQPGISAPAEMDTDPDPKALRQMAEENGRLRAALQHLVEVVDYRETESGRRSYGLTTRFAGAFQAARSALPRNEGEG